MTRRPAVRSIHDADTRAAARSRARRSARSRHLRVAAAVTCVALALGAVTGWVLTGRTADGAPAPGAQGTVVELWIDGWSLATLGDRVVTASQDGQERPVVFTPATPAQVEELLGQTPEVVQAAVARVVTGATDLACTADGCTADGARVSLGALSGSGGPGGDLLDAHGIAAGLLLARVPIDPSGGPVTVAAGNWEPVMVPSSWPVAASDLDPDSPAAAATLGNGMQQGRWLLAAGLGRIFVPDPAWLDAEDPRGVAWPEPQGETPSRGAALVTASADVVTAWSGLGADLEVARGWSTSQLTLATSPTKGCSPGILCFPGEVPVSVSVNGREVVDVVDDAGTRGVVLVDDVTISATLPGPVPAAGLQEPLEGPVSVRGVTAVLYAGGDLSPVDWAGLVEPGDVQQYPVADVLENVRLAGRSWRSVS